MCGGAVDNRVCFNILQMLAASKFVTQTPNVPRRDSADAEARWGSQETDLTADLVREL